METNKILSADILDLLFEGRNKEYGAYDLRKSYNRRLGRAMALTSGVVVVLFCFGFVSGRGHVRSAPMVKDVVIAPPPAIPLPPLPPPPVVPKTLPQVATIRVTPPRVVPDAQVDPRDAPPENKDMEDVKIGTTNKDGVKDAGLDVGPPSDAGKGLIAAPKKEDDEGVFNKVEIESSYPGGLPAWARFLHKNLNYPEDAIDKGIQGPVMVQFIVDKEGNVSDIEVVAGPTDGGLREEAIRVIRKSGKWTPAVQNGRNVKSYKRQPVIFTMGE